MQSYYATTPHAANTETNDWLTPDWILEPLGQFDLDPCASVSQPSRCATSNYRFWGLEEEWLGRVWLNPPYAAKTMHLWMKKMAIHNHGTALVFARCETAWFQESVWAKASALLFLRGRVRFLYPDLTPAASSGGAGSVLIAYGHEDAKTLHRAHFEGQFKGYFLPLTYEVEEFQDSTEAA